MNGAKRSGVSEAVRANEHSERPSGPFKTRLSVTRIAPSVLLLSLSSRPGLDLKGWLKGGSFSKVGKQSISYHNYILSYIS